MIVLDSTFRFTHRCGSRVGSFLGIFLDRDGGPRQGAIRLPPEKTGIHPTIPEEESVPPSPTFGQTEPQPFVRRISQKLFGYFASRIPRSQQPSSHVGQPAVPLGSPQPRSDGPRAFSRTSRVNGSAYGYGSNYRQRLASNATTVAARKGSLANSLRRRRRSAFDAEDSAEGSDLNFAQRLLMANENAVTNIADLWVAAAMNVDNEDPFETDEDEEIESNDSTDSLDLGEPLIGMSDPVSTTPTSRGRRKSRSRTTQSASPTRRSSHHPNHVGTSLRTTSNLTPHTSPQHRSTSRAFTSMSGLPPSRRLSSAVPSIFSHPGVKGPPAFLEAQRLLSAAADENSAAAGENTNVNAEADIEAFEEKQPSLTSQLPILVIVQYGMMALHTTTHDQIFMSYLVTYALPILTSLAHISFHLGIMTRED